MLACVSISKLLLLVLDADLIAIGKEPGHFSFVGDCSGDLGGGMDYCGKCCGSGDCGHVGSTCRCFLKVIMFFFIQSLSISGGCNCFDGGCVCYCGSCCCCGVGVWW